MRVFIVEDHPLVRLGLEAALSHSEGRFEVAGVAPSVASFKESFPSARADVLLLDIILPDGTGIDIARELRKAGSPVRILALSAETGRKTIKELFEIGIDGFVGKSIPTSELLTAIEYVADGAEFYGKDIAKIIRDVRFAKDKEKPEFTEREEEIVNLAIKGLSAKQISSQLHISVNTVNTHKDNIFKKLGINSSVELVLWALDKGIIDL